MFIFKYFTKLKWLYSFESSLIVICIALIFLPRFKILDKWDMPTYYSVLYIPLGSFSMSLFHFILIIVFTCFILAIIAERKANKKHTKLLDILLEDCDPNEFLKRYEPLTKKGKRLTEVQKVVLSHYASGLHAIGNTTSAIEIMEDFLTEPVQKNNFANQSFFYCALCNFYCSENIKDIEKAKYSLKKAKKFFLESESNINFSACRNYIEHAQQKLMFLEGDTDAPLKFFLNSLDTAKTKQEKVCTHYLIAQIYEKTQDEKQKIKHLKFVAQRGNKMYIATKAREELSKIENN